VSSVLRPHQHSIGYTGDGFYRSKDPTNSIKVLKEMLQNRKKTENVKGKNSLHFRRVLSKYHTYIARAKFLTVQWE